MLSSNVYIMTATALSVVFLSTMSVAAPLSTSQYMKMRSMMIDENERGRIGSDLVLSLPELIVNDIFMKEKRAMIESSRVNRTIFSPSRSFYSSKSEIDKTYLYQLIHKMPKGAALHTHDQSMVSMDWIIKNVTYRDNVYMCLKEQSYLLFGVFNKSVSSQTGCMTRFQSTYQSIINQTAYPLEHDCDWKLVTKEREMSKNVQQFDLNLRNNLSLMAADPFVTFPDNQAAWAKFGRYFRQVGQLLYYIPIFRDMLWQTMKEFREANIQYIEVRVNYVGLYDLNGTVYNREYCVQLVKEVSEAFIEQYPDFLGMKIIFSGIRFQSVSVVLDEVKDVMMLHKKYPDVVAGYDLSGNEALYKPLSYYTDALLYPSLLDPPYYLPYFLHVGETGWQGTETGYNVVDALLLNSTRVGHAYALSKHPHLMKLYKERNIPIEVQPLSNQVLRLVNDFRNHPMVSLIADNYPIVISCDDRTTMDTAPLSHDFFIVFTAMSSDRADLTLLKQLAINSIRFSTLTDVQKQRAMTLWQTKWDQFIMEVPNEQFTTVTPPVTSSIIIPTHNNSTNPNRNNASPAHDWTYWWQCNLFLGSVILNLYLQ